MAAVSGSTLQAVEAGQHLARHIGDHAGKVAHATRLVEDAGTFRPLGAIAQKFHCVFLS
jgi:hypothetical protein